MNHSGSDDAIELYIKKLYMPSFISSILKDEGISLKKSFGQNFLINRDIARRLLEYAKLDESDTVLEIGPGLGTLTFSLAQRVKRVVAVELDSGLVRCLEKKINELTIRNIDIVHNDFIKMGMSDFMKLGNIDRVVSNFPYSIGIRAILKIIEEMNSVQRITGTVQREMAMRLAAKPGMKDYTYTSVIVQCNADIHLLEKSIAPKNFFPMPEVESAIISLASHHERDVIPEEFRDVVRAGFSNRRKNLVNNLLGLKCNVSKKQLQEMVKQLFGDVHVRAEQLTVEDFMHLTGRLFQRKIVK